MDERIRAAICRIDIRQNGANVSRGTGALVASGQVLTAFHVVGNRTANPPAVYPGEIHVTFPSHETKGRLSALYDARTDWALVELEQSPSSVRPVPLSSRCVSTDAWETFGFPDDNPGGMVQTGSVENEHGDLDRCSVLQLYSQEAAAGKGGQVKGLSGSPVLVKAALAGVMRFALMKESQTVAGTLYACPIDTVLELTGNLLPVPDPCYGLPGLELQTLPSDPFRYLARFKAADAEIFFGRHAEIRQLYEMAMAEQDGNPLILLYGQSGVGKSSFLDAGMVPRLKWFNSAVYIRRDRTRSLTETLIGAVPGSSSSPPKGTPTGGVSITLGGVWQAAEEATGKPLIVILDQLEEVFTQPNPHETKELDELVEEIRRAFCDPNRKLRGKLILSFRKEWFSEIQKHIETARIPYVKLFLETMCRDSVIDCVNGLTSTNRLKEKYNLWLDEYLPAAIANDLLADTSSPVAPVLQILLTQMWASATAVNGHKPEFTLKLYTDLKQHGGVTRDFLDRQLKALRATDPESVDSGLAIDLLAFHTNSALTVEQRSQDDLRKAYPHCIDKVLALVRRCSELVLLVDPGGDAASGMGASRLSHDTLAPYVRARFDISTEPGPRACRILAGRAAEWNELDEAPLEPWELKIVEAGLSGTRKLSEKQERLIKAARIIFDGEERRRRNIQRAKFAGVVALIAGLITFAVLRQHVAYERDLAELHQSYSTILEQLDGEPLLALANSIGTANRSLLGQNQVLSELQFSLSQSLSEARETYSYLGFSPVQAISVGGQSVAVGRKDGTLETHHLDGTLSAKAFTGHGGMVTGVSYSPDGAWFVSAGGDGHLKIWNRDVSLRADLTPPLPPGSDPKHPRYAKSVTVIPNSATVASGWSDGTLWIVPVYQPERLFEVPIPWDTASSDKPAITALASVRDRTGDTVIAIGNSQGSVALWNFTQRKFLRPPWRAHHAGVTSLDLSVHSGPDSTLQLATAAADGVVRQWNESGASRNADMEFHAAINALRFDPSGKVLAVAAFNGVVYLVYLDGASFRPPFRGFIGGVNAVAFDSESLHLIAGSTDGTVRVLDMAAHGLGMQEMTDGTRMVSLAFQPDGQLLAGSSMKNVYLWHVDRDSLLRPLEPIGTPIPLDLATGTALAIDPKGHWLVLGNQNSIRLLDLQSGDLDTGKLSEKYPVDCQTVRALAFSSDSALLAVGGEASDVVDLWDTKTRRPVAKLQMNYQSPMNHTTRAIVFSPDNKYLFAGSDDFRIRRWKLTSGQIASAGNQKPVVMGPLDGGVYALAFSAGGKFLLAGDASGILSRWYNDGTDLQDKFQVHNGPVQNIRVHYLGEALYTSSDEGVVKVHSHRTEELLAPLLGGKAGGTFGLAMSADGKTVASGNNDGSVQLWRAAWPELAEEDCRRFQAHAGYEQTDILNALPIMAEASAACKSRFWENCAATTVFELTPTKK